MIDLSHFWDGYTREEQQLVVKRVIALLNEKMDDHNDNGEEISQEESALFVPCFRFSDQLFIDESEDFKSFADYCRLHKTEILTQIEYDTRTIVVYFVTKQAYFLTVQKFPWLLRGEYEHQ